MTFAELEKVLLGAERPSEFFEDLRRNGGLDDLPELKALIGVPQNKEYHLEGDVWTHTMMVLDAAAARRGSTVYPVGFMLSALCHDFGKAVSTTVSDDGTVHSYGHEAEGLPLVRSFLERLTDDEYLIGYVLNMTELHMEPNITARAGSKIKKTNRLFDKAAEPSDLIELAVCDGLGKLPVCDDSEDFLKERYRIFMDMMARPYATKDDLADAGIVISDEILAYAHKLRLAGVSREDQIRHCLSYKPPRTEKKQSVQ